MPEETAVVQNLDPDPSQNTDFTAAKATSAKPIVTIALIAINVIVFLTGVFVAPESFMQPTTQMLLAWGANFAPLTLHGESWRLITACFLHVGVIHIAMNMFILFQIGIFAEILFGELRFLLVYLLAGLAGSLASVAAQPPIVSAGASGAVFGVYGAVLAFLLIQRGVIPTAQAWSIAKSAGIFIVYNLIYGLARPGIDVRAHIGGLIGGFLVGAALARPLSPGPQKSYALRSAVVTMCALAVAWGSLSAMSKSLTPRDELYRNILAAKSVSVGKSDRVIYSGTATENDAQNLGKALVSTGYFHDKSGAALLKKDASGTTISFITGEKDPAKPGDGSPARPDLLPRLVPLPWDDPDFLARVQNTGTIIAPSVGGPPVNIALLTRDGVFEKTIRVDTAIAKIGTRDSVWYSGGVTAGDAQELGNALKKIGFFQDKGTRVFLAKDGNSEDVSVIVREGAWKDTRVLPAFAALNHKLSSAMAGKTIHLHLVDDKLERKADF